jgi:hypothetical protein
MAPEISSKSIKPIMNCFTNQETNYRNYDFNFKLINLKIGLTLEISELLDQLKLRKITRTEFSSKQLSLTPILKNLRLVKIEHDLLMYLFFTSAIIFLNLDPFR